jgi:uncharacterized protein (DUF427 family)
MKATWNNNVLAESNETIVIEGNQYFPPASVKKEYLVESTHTSVCPWKGLAHYYTVVAGGEQNENAAWYYPEPKEGSIERVSKDFTNYVAFWKGVEVSA